MFHSFKTAVAAAALLGLSSANEVEAAEVTPQAQGYAQCDLGNRKASEGRMSTHFGNAFWSHMGCAKWKEAFDILDRAPKAHPDERLPTEEDYNRGDATAECYIESFAYWFNYHVVRPYEGYDEPMVSHGFYLLKETTFSEIQRAVLAACEPGIS